VNPSKATGRGVGIDFCLCQKCGTLGLEGRAAGRGEVRLYDLRHCYAQWLSAAGAPEAAIQVGMRHRSASMTRRYSRARDTGENASLLGRVMFPAAPEPRQLAAGPD